MRVRFRRCRCLLTVDFLLSFVAIVSSALKALNDYKTVRFLTQMTQLQCRLHIIELGYRLLLRRYLMP